ncbi:MAG: methyltransferase [Terriglobales bacterium]
MAETAAAEMMRLLWPGAMVPQVIRVAAELGLADEMAGGAKSAEDLAKATHTHGPSLARLLRALASVGVFAQDEDGRYRQTPLSDILRRDNPETLRPWALAQSAHFFWRPMGELGAAVRSGQPPFEHLYGAPFFEYMAAHPEDAAVFNGAMSSSATHTAAIVGAYDFSKFDCVVDVGGGRGALLAAILAAHPKLRGILYDLPEVTAGAAALRTKSLDERCKIVSGDFFQAVPAGADGYLLKGILHDWNDEAALRILKNCRRAMHPGGTLLLAETVLDAAARGDGALMDMLMMALTSGRERTEGEFAALLQEAGFALVQVIRTASGAALVESRA